MSKINQKILRRELIKGSGIFVTVARPVNRDRRYRDQVYVKLGFPTNAAEQKAQEEFSKIVAYTREVEETKEARVGWEVPSPLSSGDEIKDSYRIFDEEVDGMLTEAWVQLIDDVCSDFDAALGPAPIGEDADPN